MSSWNPFFGSGGARGEFYSQPAHAPEFMPLAGGTFQEIAPGISVPTQTTTGQKIKDEIQKEYLKEAVNARSAMDAQHEAMDFNRVEAAKARDWQEQMYGSRFQKTIADIKKAGLNPYILNAFSPGGFSGGSAAQIAANVFKSYSQSQNKNINKKEPTGFDWLSAILPIVGMIVGSFTGPALGTIGGAIGGLGARALRNRKK